jgi:hypothetical protein
MTRRWFIVACCALLLAPVVSAQKRGDKPPAKADPITGTWTGELVPPDGGNRAIKMELKFDGKTVSGTVSGMPNPADVKAGSTFDPKTGALKLQLGRADGPAVLLTLEGTVVKGTASGKATGDGGGGTFKLTKKP